MKISLPQSVPRSCGHRGADFGPPNSKVPKALNPNSGARPAEKLLVLPAKSHTKTSRSTSAYTSSALTSQVLVAMMMTVHDEDYDFNHAVGNEDGEGRR